MHNWDVCSKNISKVLAAGHASFNTAANADSAFPAGGHGQSVQDEEEENDFVLLLISLKDIFPAPFHRFDHLQNAITGIGIAPNKKYKEVLCNTWQGIRMIGLR